MSDATTLAAAIAEGRTTARAAMAASLEAAEHLGSLGAVVRLDPAMGLRDAEAADAAPASARGPFHGVPFLGKDLGSAARGLAPGGGSAAIRALSPDPAADSDLFARFRAGGLLPFGLTTVPELGLALTSEPVASAGAQNPFDPALSAGGSSGGAALAVALGIVAIAHATDAGGSIRVPAACCGLWGLKPSRGRIPQGPTYGNHLLGLASELVLARSLRDLSTAYRIAARTEAGPATGPARARIAVCIPEGVAAPQARAVEACAEALRQAGHETFARPAPEALGEAASRAAARVFALSAADWLDALGVPDAEIPPFLVAIRAMGRSIPGTEVFALAREIARITDVATALFSDADALLVPVLAGPPPARTAFPSDETDPGARFRRMGETAPLATLANVAGLPALAFPAAFDGLPIGAQLLGPIGSDAALLALAEPLATFCTPPHRPIAGVPA